MTSYSKCQVAVELLTQAVRLHSEKNLVAAIVLSGAAQQILRDVCKTKAISSTLNDLAQSHGKDVKELHRLIVAVYNKFKHADVEQGDVAVVDEEARVLITLAAADLMRLNLPLTDDTKKIVDYANSMRA
jgi:hypothetical protein